MADRHQPARRYYVYAVAVAGRVAYIGKGCGKRAWHHLTPACRNHRLKAAIAGARSNGRDVRVRILKANLTETAAFQLERRWIARFRERLTNATLGQLSSAEKIWYEQVAEWERHRLMSHAEIKRRGTFKGISVDRQIEISRIIEETLVETLRDVRAQIPGNVPPVRLRVNDLIIIQ